MLDPELVSGFAKIDSDHEKMLDYALRLISLKAEDRHSALSSLIDCVTDHCVTEERLMRYSKYPLTAEHSFLHREMQDEIIKIFKMIMIAQVNAPILHSLRQRIYDHILIHDKNLITFLRKEGITSSDVS